MTLRTKLSLVILLDLVATLAIIGFLAFTQSKIELESLARELLRAQTEYAYAQCENHNELYGAASDDLIKAIQSVRIADEGYIFVFSTEAAHRAELVIHPSDAGKYIGNFPHIRQIISEIDSAGGRNRTANFIVYAQGTDAKGRQGEKKIGYFVYFAPWKWVLMSSGYERDLYGRTDVIRRRVIEAIILVGLVSLLVINFFVLRMFRPMQHLIAATKRVASGDLDATIPIESRDEIGRLAGHFNYMLANLKENMRVWQELQIARRLQTEMLPQGEPDLPGVQIEAKSTPATEVGGDFYDFITIDENRFALIIGDVSGKGISGAMVMSSALSALRFATEERDSTDAILKLANRRLVKDIQRNMFVATFFAIYDRQTRTLTYTNAGQTMPILLRGEAADFLRQSDAERFPLGIRPEVNYREMRIEMLPGDLLVCYTDGIVELSNGKLDQYGFERFTASIRKHGHEKLPVLHDKLILDATLYIGQREYNDDVTIVLIKFT